MTNQIDNTGLLVDSNTEIVDSIKADLRLLFGADINLESNSPDGQMVQIYAQVATDMLELLLSVYNSFDVESAGGIVLDQRVALNGISRIQGTFTVTPITVTVDRALTLPGLDAAINDPDGEGFTVSDDAGNQFILAATAAIGAAGAQVLSFRAKNIGRTETTLNTITNQVTVTLGVTAVNNPTTYTALGVDEETDVQLKIRRIRSFFLASTGPADAVQAALLAVPGVTDAYVAENTTAGTVDTIPAHSIWAIVEGGADADIAAVLYTKRGAGCGMAGAEEVVVSRPNTQSLTVKFDRPLTQDLYIEFGITPKTTGVSFDLDWIKAQIVAQLSYGINQQATANDVVIIMNQIQPDAILTAVGVSEDGITFAEMIAPATMQTKYVLDVARIEITE